MFRLLRFRGVANRERTEHPKSWLTFFGTLAILLLATLTSCSQSGTGASTVETPLQPQEFTITDFAGSFTLTQLTINSRSLPLAETFTVEIDTAQTSFALISSCNRKLGSYSFFADGRASITITGGSSKPCSSKITQQEQTAVEALSGITGWEPGTNSDEVVLITQPSDPSAVVVTLTRTLLKTGGPTR